MSLVQENGLENTKVVLTGSSGRARSPGVGQARVAILLGRHPTPLLTTDPRVTIDRHGVGEDRIVELVTLAG